MYVKYYCELEGYELRYGKADDAGLDLPTPVPVELAPGEFKKVDTGVHVELPAGHFGLLDMRSSIGGKGVNLLSRTVDEGYKGSIGLNLVNHSSETLRFDTGERLAQLIVTPVTQVTLERVDSPDALKWTARGTTAYGSTGTTEYI